MPISDEPEPLFIHTRRPAWGLAILASEGRDERLYQFQDGQLRTFKRGFYELIEPASGPEERAADVARDLRAMLHISRGRRESHGGCAPKSLERMVSFDDQQRLFERLHPQGFADPSWIAKVRGGDGVKPSKRHREPAIREASERLSAAELDRAIAAGDYRAVCEAARAVLAATDLAGSKDAGALRRLAAADEAGFATAARDLLHGQDAYGARLGRFVSALSRTRGERVTWPLATALSALVHPSEHAVVKPSIVRPQAQWIAPTLVYEATPTPALYARLLAVVETVHGRLTRAGHSPRDLLDVHDFMLETLRPRAGAPATSLEGPS